MCEPPVCGPGTCLSSETEEDDAEKSLCYTEGIIKDYCGSELLDNVWFAVRPPKHFSVDTQPYVSARTIEITRAQLTGKVHSQKDLVNADLPPASKAKEPATMERRKQMVRFISTPVKTE